MVPSRGVVGGVSVSVASRRYAVLHVVSPGRSATTRPLCRLNPRSPMLLPRKRTSGTRPGGPNHGIRKFHRRRKRRVQEDALPNRSSRTEINGHGPRQRPRDLRQSRLPVHHHPRRWQFPRRPPTSSCASSWLLSRSARTSHQKYSP